MFIIIGIQRGEKRENPYGGGARRIRTDVAGDCGAKVCGRIGAKREILGRCLAWGAGFSGF